ncbi:MAG: T9SS type A sorting domain-containing protein, partial [Bacteroidota bacterium]|nr:T9SS type A sorting domain-containing protein [Bacteroidota bacterium]
DAIGQSRPGNPFFRIGSRLLEEYRRGGTAITMIDFRPPVFCRIALLSGLMLVAAAAAGQTSPAQSSINPASRAYLAQGDPAGTFNLTHVEGGIIDSDLNIWRAGFGLSPNMAVQATPEATARAWVDQYGHRYGIASPANLRLIRDTGTHGIRHVTFQQVLGEIPVYERYVHINLGHSGLPTMVHSSYAPHIEPMEAPDTQSVISEAQARSVAGTAVTTGQADIHSAKLFMYPEPDPRLIWSVDVSPAEALGSWRVLVDARTGELIRIFDQLKYHHTTHKSAHGTATDTTGRGLIWDPDPLSMAGVAYGGFYRDNRDANHDVLAQQLVEVDLEEITLGADSLYRLEGPYVAIRETPGLYTPPALADPDSFLFQRDDNHFEAVMAYYHLHASQLYIQSLDIGRPVMKKVVDVRVSGIDNDNSWYDVRKNRLTFGSGGVDDGEDAEVILHEYGHAVLHSGTPVNISDKHEGSAYHEGFSDYWALSYTRDLIERGVIPPRDWRQVFDWDAGIRSDGRGRFWPGRYIDPSRTYNHATCRVDSEVRCKTHLDGTIMANVLMRLWGINGKYQTDRLVLFSHAYMGRPFTMESAIQALVQADIDFYGGENVALINRLFRDSAYPTHIARIPEQPGSLHLEPNYPNPFRVTTNITYSLDRAAPVRMEVFNVLGQRVMVFREVTEPAGLHTRTLDLSDQPAGMYLLRITTGDQQLSQPLLRVRY